MTLLQQCEEYLLSLGFKKSVDAADPGFIFQSKYRGQYCVDFTQSKNLILSSYELYKNSEFGKVGEDEFITRCVIEMQVINNLEQVRFCIENSDLWLRMNSEAVPI